MKPYFIEHHGVNRSAGCMIMAIDTGRFLLSFRSEHSPSPQTWATWGGKCDAGEYPEDAARREVEEEAGLAYTGPLQHVHHFEKRGFHFDTYLALVRHEFEPVLSKETAGYRWVELGEFPEPLHEGVKDLLGSRIAVGLLERAVENRFWTVC
jgi:8-oxo-dGTP pyrophosphatase MutT (NUDIX family)